MINELQPFRLVIPTLNAGQEFKTVMDGIKNQSHPPEEIIIVDSGSTDETLALANQYSATVIPIEPSRFNHGATRNLGIEAASSPYIALMTQDAIPANENLFAAMIRSMEHYHAAGCYARQLPRPPASPLVRRNLSQWISGTEERRVTRFASPQELWDMHPTERYLACVFDNVTSMVRRSVWQTIPFPVTPFGEDIEWAFRVLCSGETIVYEPDACVIHSHERDSAYTYKRTYIDHYRMHELFRLRTLPSRWLTWKAWLRSSVNDLTYLANEGGSFSHIAAVPADAWAEVWGQHNGARDAARGLPARPTSEV